MQLAPDPQLLAEAGCAAGVHLDIDRIAPVSGGDISAAFRCTDDCGQDFFLKLNRADFAEAFAAEADGLHELAAGSLRVPAPLATGSSNGRAWLLLEWVDLRAGQSGDDTAARQLGAGLADLHRRQGSRFGWHRDNRLGASPQDNSPAGDWATFFAEHRLRPQLERAADNRAPRAFVERGMALMVALPRLLAGHAPAPSLLHGDLWGGNWGVDAAGAPVLFDPAVYYGDRETDLAMTRLFGGFPRQFYSAYEAAWPLPPGHEQRCALYQLYHVINHFNLFGGAYLGQADTMLDTLLAQVT